MALETAAAICQGAPIDTAKITALEPCQSRRIGRATAVNHDVKARNMDGSL
jgi:hypothetical protein|tara:strand:+ start:2791 stop:2943 length:153 start_codon:yes stop_codon:yes gene_type:complete